MSSAKPMEFQSYNAGWLQQLAEAFKDEFPWLIEASRRCTHVYKESEYYYYFVDPNSEAWKHTACIRITDKIHGDLVLDVLEGDRIGGLEFLSKLLESC